MAPPAIENCTRHPRLTKFGKLNVIGKNSAIFKPIKYKKSKYVAKIPNKSDLMLDIGSWSLYEAQNQKIIENFNIKKTAMVEIHFDSGSITFPHKNEILKLQGEIPVVLPWGSITQQDLELESISKCQEFCCSVAKSVGVFTKNAKYYEKFQKLALPEFCALTAPGVKLTNLKAYALLYIVFFILDDIFDNFLDFLAKPVPVFELHRIARAFRSLLTGENLDAECMEELQKFNFPVFLPMCKLIKKLRKEVLRMGNNSAHAKYFFETFATYIDACCWETHGWTKRSKADANAMKKFCIYGREFTIGLIPTLEFLCLLRDVRLSHEIRMDPMFQTLQKLVSHETFLLNDVFSLKKEIANQERVNIILIMNMKKPAEYCLKKVLDDIRTCVQDIEDIQTQLRKKFLNEKSLEDYFDIANTFMDGHLQWVLLTERYGNETFEVNLYL